MDAKLLKPLKFCFELIKFVGLLQDGKENWKYRIYGILSFNLTITLFIGAEIASLINADNLEMAAENLCILAPAIIFYMKLANFLTHLRSKSFEEMKRKIEEIIEVSSDERFASRKRIKSKLHVLMVIFKVFYANCVFISIGIIITIVFLKINPYNVFKAEYDESPLLFYLAGFHMIITAITSNLTFTCLNLLPVVYLSYAIGFIDELCDRLKLLGSNTEQEELQKCFKIHQLIQGFVNDIKTNFGVVLFFQNIISRLIISLLIFQSSTANGLHESFQALMLCMLMTLEIFLPCYFGHQLTSSEQLSDSIFHSEWTSMTKDNRISIFTFMENLKSPIKISMFGLFYADLISFTETIKESYSLAVFLNDLNH